MRLRLYIPIQRCPVKPGMTRGVMADLIGHLRLVIILTGNLLASCTKPQPSEESVQDDTLWNLTTKAGPHVDQVATFRASLLDNTNGVLRSDGSYSGYYNADGWLTPCRTNAAGDALDTGGSVIAWDAPNWYDLTDKNSQYALRGGSKRVYVDATYFSRHAVTDYSMVLTSPAVRMSSFRPTGAAALSGSHVTDPNEYHWGFAMDRKTSTWAISEVDDNLYLNATYLQNRYVYDFEPTLYEHRSMLTVKIACGALAHANINKVYFTNIISEAYYMPMWNLLDTAIDPHDPYEEWKKDGSNIVGNYDPATYDPLATYYITNTYPANAGEATGTGDIFAVPVTDPDVHLVRRPAQTPDFIANNEWDQFDLDADEWVKGDDTKYVLTPIKDFPILSLDYSIMVGDQYKYEAIMPKVVVLSGTQGNIKTTVRIPANLEPMKKYTMWLFVSNVYIQAVLTVSDWTIHSHWSDNPLDPNYNQDTASDTFGAYKEIGTILARSEWETVTTTDAEGSVDN